METLKLVTFDEKRGLFGVDCADGEVWCKLPMRANIAEIGEVSKDSWNSVQGIAYFKEIP